MISGCSAGTQASMCHGPVGTDTLNCDSGARGSNFIHYDPSHGTFAQISVGGTYANSPTGDVKDARYYFNQCLPSISPDMWEIQNQMPCTDFCLACADPETCSLCE